MKRKSLLSVSVLAYVLLTIAPFVDADESHLPKITLLTENYGKFNYSLQNRAFEHKERFIGGTSADVVKQLMAQTDIPYRMKLRTWSVSYERALTKPNFGVFSTARTEARENLFEWIGPIAQYELALFVKAGNRLVLESLDDIRLLRIGGYKGSAATNFLEQQGISVSVLTNDSLNPKRLHDDLIDVWVGSDASAFDLAKEAGYPYIRKAYVIKTVNMYLAMNPNTHPEILSQLKTSYQLLKTEGRISLAAR